MNDDAQRAMMAAHLTDIIGRRARTGCFSLCIWLSSWIREVLTAADPFAAYVMALRIAAEEPEAIDAAVAAIRDGKPPPGSLAAEVEKMRGRANEAMPSSDAASYLTGRAHVAIDVLNLLGCAPTKEPT